MAEFKTPTLTENTENTKNTENTDDAHEKCRREISG